MSNTSGNESRLTSAAREALEEEVELHRERLIRQAAQDQPDGSISSIGILRAGAHFEPSRVEAALLLATLQRFESDPSELASNTRMARLRSAVVIVGATVGIASAALLAIAATASWQFALGTVLLVTSIATGVTAISLNRAATREEHLRRDAQRHFREISLKIADIAEGTVDESIFGREIQFLEAWKQLESAVSELLETVTMVPPGTRVPLSSALSQLERGEILTQYEVGQIRKVLKVRNDLVHNEGPMAHDWSAQVEQIHAILAAIERAKDIPILRDHEDGVEIDNEVPDERPRESDIS